MRYRTMILSLTPTQTAVTLAQGLAMLPWPLREAEGVEDAGVVEEEDEEEDGKGMVGVVETPPPPRLELPQRKNGIPDCQTGRLGRTLK